LPCGDEHDDALSTPRSIERGVEMTVWLATLDDGPTGGSFKDCRQIEW
jgi:hypothetical protein